MENKKQKLIEEAKRLYEGDIVPRNPPFVIDEDLNLLIY